jgi:TolA-binding protein
MDNYKSYFLLLFIACAIAVIGINCDPVAPKRGNKLFHEGRGLVITGQYSGAVPVLSKYMHLHPSGKHASRAGLFLGKAYLALGNTTKAAEIWSLTAKNYPATLEGHKCRYKLALLLMLTGEREKAAEAFGRLANSPDGPLAPEAEALRRFLLSNQ